MQSADRRRRRLLGSLAWAVVVAACRGGGGPPTATPTATPTGDGLIGRYYASRDWTGPVVLERRDPVIQFDWSDRHPIDAAVFSVRWEGFLVIPPGQGGTFILSLRSDDAAWLFVDGQLVVDDGGIHTARLASGQIDLQPGPHRLRIDYVELQPRLSVISFEWRAPGGQRGVVPGVFLYSQVPIVK